MVGLLCNTAFNNAIKAFDRCSFKASAGLNNVSFPGLSQRG